MKRVICTAVLLLFIAAATWLSTARLKAQFDDLERYLESSVVAFQSGDVRESNRLLDCFDGVLRDNKLFLHLFVRRDILYSLKNANATLRWYMSDESKQDFYAEAQRALVQLYAAQDTLFYNL